MLKKFTLSLLLLFLALQPILVNAEVEMISGVGVADIKEVAEIEEVNLELRTESQELRRTPVSVFVREGCSHCRDEEEFLTDLLEIRDDFTIFYHDIGETAHYQYFETLTSLEKIPRATPITLVGNTIIQGFGSAQSTGIRIIELLDISQGKRTLDLSEFIAVGGSRGKIETEITGACEKDVEICETPEIRHLVDIPFIGAIDIAKYSLPTISIILGFIDGFNPCAMWVLVTFLIVLLQIGDRKRMFQIAILFILAEAVMYFLILNVWFTAWDFVGMDKFVTPIVGLIAIGGGVFFLYEGATSDGTCKITNPEQRAKIHFRVKELAAKPLTWITAAGVLALAFSVNIIEFACSIGIPQAFTKILEINLLSTFAEQMLILLYTLFYMVDDFIVFGIALAGIEKLGITHKYSKYSNLIGGVLMLILGGLLVFAPELLKFI